MESDDEWDEILGQPDHHPTPGHTSHPQQQQITITLEDEADDGLDFLERELLGEDEPMGDGDGDGDGDGYGDEDEDLEEEIIHGPSRVGAAGAGAGPMSMTQFAGGDAAVDDEDDEYSSSEESEED
jgi:hypothetical protein